ncbi:MAG: DUF6763 family protein [Gammaproteobacteria bacterium]
MATEVEPITGNWYEHTERGERFEVVDVDEDRGIVEIQYADGDLSELDIDDWYDMELEPIESPDDGGETEDEDVAEDAIEAPEHWPGGSRRSRRTLDEDEDVEEDEEELDEEGPRDERPWKEED